MPLAVNAGPAKINTGRDSSLEFSASGCSICIVAPPSAPSSVKQANFLPGTDLRRGDLGGSKG